MASLTFSFVSFLFLTVIVIAFSTEFLVPWLVPPDHFYNYNYSSGTFEGKTKSSAYSHVNNDLPAPERVELLGVPKPTEEYFNPVDPEPEIVNDVPVALHEQELSDEYFHPVDPEPEIIDGVPVALHEQELSDEYFHPVDAEEYKPTDVVIEPILIDANEDNNEILNNHVDVVEVNTHAEEHGSDDAINEILEEVYDSIEEIVDEAQDNINEIVEEAIEEINEVQDDTVIGGIEGLIESEPQGNNSDELLSNTQSPPVLHHGGELPEIEKPHMDDGDDAPEPEDLAHLEFNDNINPHSKLTDPTA